ncbi:hypothetical protein STCU_10659 [Strigomonas culicis]|uniref:PH domain-containing protein n=1 Tax=Strigomonas culicis TaxID=28005 RepID=S9TLY6_9TRYP|nr:hypothetical protein STCU_10659 [Strigomonas culicis]|eukprot:EPY17378.1 hypothetical protein STCU_10659 [Strigomonas culicis]
MWKPRSTLTPAEGSANKRSFFRGFGALKWKRRFLFLSDGAFHYGKAPHRKDKTVPLADVRRVALVSSESVLQAKAPSAYADFAWLVATAERTILFCAEDAPTMRLWATFFHTWLHRPPAARLPAVTPATSEPPSARASPTPPTETAVGVAAAVEPQPEDHARRQMDEVTSPLGGRQCATITHEQTQRYQQQRQLQLQQ